jgi:hypothetical protein
MVFNEYDDMFQQNKYNEAFDLLKALKISGVQWTPGVSTEMMWTCIESSSNKELQINFLEEALLR